MENNKKYINTRDVANANRCTKLGFLESQGKEVPKISTFAEAAIRKAQYIKFIARGLLQNGVDISGQQYLNFDQYVQITKELIQQKVPVIYQACFQTLDKRCKVDMLEIKDNTITIYLVSSKTKLDADNLLKLAFIYSVVKEALPGFKLNACIVTLNSKYVKKGDLNHHELFNAQDVTRKIISAQVLVKRGVYRANKIRLMNRLPQVKIGLQCNTPYECPFKSLCWKDIPKDSVFDISKLWELRKVKYFEQGIVEMKDIPRNAKLSEKQWMQVDCTIQKRHVIDQEAIGKFIEGLQYPIYFMDFETVQYPIPLHDGTSPYEAIPFQYSLHKETSNGKLSHTEFLSNGKGDPRLLFIQKLLENIGTKGTVLVYNKSFEIGRLKELSSYFTEYKSVIQKVIDRIKDLMKPFEDRNLYHPHQKGSVSLKAVLPAWVPELSYEGLGIGNGVAASEQFEKMCQPFTTQKEKSQIKKNLLEYCRMDTFAMVRLLQVLRSLIQEKKLIKIKY